MACFTKTQQRNGTNSEFEKYVKSIRKEPSQFRLYTICIWWKREHGCVRNDSETHSTGVTGLHSRLRWSCNPVTQSRAFHCHFAHQCVLAIKPHANIQYWRCGGIKELYSMRRICAGKVFIQSTHNTQWSSYFVRYLLYMRLATTIFIDCKS